jgi:hypothetical protein
VGLLDYSPTRKKNYLPFGGSGKTIKPVMITELVKIPKE